MLKALSKTELNAFGRFVHSPFFNPNEEVMQLFELLYPLYPDFPEDEVNYKDIFRSIWKKGKVDKQQLRYLMTELTKLLEQYLAYTQYEQEEVFEEHFLLRALNRKDLDKYFQQKLRQTNKSRENYPYRHADFFEKQVLLEEDSYEFTSSKNNRAIDSSLQNLVDNLDIHYLAKKLKYSCEIINRMNVLSVEYNITFLENILEFLKEHRFEDVPAINIYFQVLLTLKESENENHYQKLKVLLKEYLGFFPDSELRDIYGFVQNYCIRKINMGDSSYLRELFNNYKVLLQNEIIIENGRLAQFDFKNIVTIALRLEEFDWTEKFIAKYSPKLSPEFRKNAINYNMARLYYSRQQHRQALRLLLEVEFTDVYYHLDSKSLTLKIYYELDEIEPLLSLISTFRVYLRRNKQISAYQREIYTNLLRFVRKLVRIKTGGTQSIKALKKEIEKKKQVADITWLNGKVAEMEEMEHG